MIWFNEIDKFAAQWLRNLFPGATVDERSIVDLRQCDIYGKRCHFFGGIGGWEYALRLAGWQGTVWTGSCPCQPFSIAGRKKAEKDSRHLWPDFRRLIAECHPPVIFGEQVAGKLGREWLSGVRADLEALGYAVGAADLCAAGVGAPHIRQRLFWVGNTRCAKQRQRRGYNHWDNGTPIWLANGHIIGREGPHPKDWRNIGASRTLQCQDGKVRRVSTQPGDEPLAYRLPRILGQNVSRMGRLARGAGRNRVGRLRGYGNSIVPQLAAVFVKSYMETL